MFQYGEYLISTTSTYFSKNTIACILMLGISLTVEAYSVPADVCLLISFLVCVKGKAIPVTGHGGPDGCETSRLPHFLDNRLTDGGEVVNLTCRPPFTPRKISGTDSVRG
jgi:hypothetical protein